MKLHIKLIDIKKSLFILAGILILSSCNYAVYYTDWHELKIAKSKTYVVDYLTEIPDGTEAKITYTDSDKNHTISHITGKWKKEVTLSPSQKGKFDVIIKTDSAKTLESSITINGESITRQTQTGKNVIFHMTFKLP